MSEKTMYSDIRKVVQICIPDSRVLLFGSRARGDHNHKSDYDLLVITPHTYTYQEKINWGSKLNKSIVASLGIPVDILLNSEEEILQKIELPGHIVKTAMIEAIAL